MVCGDVHIFYSSSLGAGGFDRTPSGYRLENASRCAARFSSLTAC